MSLIWSARGVSAKRRGKKQFPLREINIWAYHIFRHIHLYSYFRCFRSNSTLSDNTKHCSKTKKDATTNFSSYHYLTSNNTDTLDFKIYTLWVCLYNAADVFFERTIHCVRNAPFDQEKTNNHVISDRLLKLVVVVVVVVVVMTYFDSYLIKWITIYHVSAIL